MANPVVAVRIPPELHERVKTKAQQEGTTPSELIRQVLTEQFPEKNAGPALLNPQTKLRPVPPRRT